MTFPGGSVADARSNQWRQRGLRAFLRRLERRVPLVAKLAIPTAAVTVVAAVLVGSFLSRGLRENFQLARASQERLIAHLVASSYRAGDPDPLETRAFLDDLRQASPTIVTARVFRRIGHDRVLWASSADPKTIAGASRTPLLPIGTPTDPAWIQLTISDAALQTALASAERQLIVSLAAAGSGAVLAVGLILYAFVFRRAARLARAARQVAAGHAAVRLPEAEGPPARDDLVNVAREFDHMLRVVEARSRQQAAVADFSQLALSGADVPELLEEAVALTARGLEVEVATALELEGDHLLVRAARGWPHDDPWLPVPLDSQAGYTLRESDPVVMADQGTEARFTPSPNLVRLGIRSGVTVVIPGPDGPYGVLAGHTRERRRFTSDDAHFLQAMANSLGAALRHRRSQTELAEAEERYRTLVEQIPAVIYIDEDDDVATARYVSPYYETLLGYSAEERMADPELWVKLLHPDDRDSVLEESRRSNETGEPFRAEYRMVAKDGRVVWVRDEGVLLRDEAGRALGWQGVLTDITDRKTAEEAVRRLALQNRLILDSAGEGIFGLDVDGRITFVNSAATGMLGWTADELVGRIDEMKNAFLSGVSHELRTPLSAVMGYALTLKQDELNLPQEERRELLDRLAANAQKLQRLLGDLLDVDRMERGILEPQRHPVDLYALARRVVEETDVRGRGVELDVEPLVAEVDGPKVERILENLLVNAAKHTPPGTVVRVRIERDDGGVLVAVGGGGAGGPGGAQEGGFPPLARGPRVPTHAPGTGIGLSLVARFAELHGGRAWVEDRPGGGATFLVSLPAPICGPGHSVRERKRPAQPAGR